MSKITKGKRVELLAHWRKEYSDNIKCFVRARYDMIALIQSHKGCSDFKELSRFVRGEQHMFLKTAKKARENLEYIESL